ncbi:MAG: 3-isopropylmalate dehydratase small subunit [Ilumatobacteraceae bacterium]
MKAVRVLTGTGVPLRRSDVDTDQIIPAEWLKRVERTGFEKGLFASWRDDRDFVLNDERYAGASFIVAGPAFGVGSSREHAVWAILQAGFDAVIAPSFSDIFRNNCTKNGLVAAAVPDDIVRAVWDAIDADPRRASSSTSSASWWRCRRPESRPGSRWMPRPSSATSKGSTTSRSR